MHDFFIFLTPFPQWASDAIFSYTMTEKQSVLIALIIFLFAALTDKLDGYIARKYNQITKLGKLLDPLADKLLITVGMIMLVSMDKIAAWVVIIILGREMMVTILRMMATIKGMILAADKLGKLKMVLQVIAIAFVLLQSQLLESTVLTVVVNLTVALATIVTLYSGIQYVKRNQNVLMG